MLNEDQPRRPWQQQGQQSPSTSPAASDVKRVAWPPKATAEVSETNDKTSISYAVTGPQQNAVDGGYQRQSQLPHKSAPRVPPKPTAHRDNLGAQSSLASSGRVAREDSNITHHQSTTLRQQSHISQEEDEAMASIQTAEPFSSNELVGERILIAKPAPPPGLVLGRPLREEAPYSQAPNAVYTSQPAFKKATTLRKLGDMVWPPKGTIIETDDAGQQTTVRVVRQSKDYRGFFGQHQLPANFPTYRAPPGTQHFGLEEGENATAM